ncbi:MAG: hypothetical protein KF829_05075 [Ferruginibacter sp.]|nr:hypothetical protein [Ferruginibacter sp.]
MNYIKHLAGFFERVSTDERLNPTHISMYVSLFQFWNASRFKNPISISRGELMRISKISAKATYHKCMKELNDFGYLKYKPSYNPFKGSFVYLFNFQTGNEQPDSTDNTKIGTGIEQAQEPYINGSNIINQTSLNLDEPAQKKEVQKVNRLGKEEKEKLRQKKKKKAEAEGESPDGYRYSAKKERSDFIVPQVGQVQEYFALQKFSSVEAAKFYNYFQSNGWLVGGRTKMKDWQAAARNWMLNANKFAKGKPVKPKAKHLHATTNKNYSEPL